MYHIWIKHKNKKPTGRDAHILYCKLALMLYDSPEDTICAYLEDAKYNAFNIRALMDCIEVDTTHGLEDFEPILSDACKDGIQKEGERVYYAAKKNTYKQIEAANKKRSSTITKLEKKELRRQEQIVKLALKLMNDLDTTTKMYNWGIDLIEENNKYIRKLNEK